MFPLVRAGGMTDIRSQKKRLTSDLIIHELNTVKPLNNRWAFSDNVIDYDSVCDWFEPLSSDELSGIRRIKICGLARKQLTALLANLPRQLQQLDIDTQFELLRGTATRLESASLRILSIEEFRVVEPDAFGEDLQIPEGRAILCLTAPDLKAVYLGSGAIKYILFANPKSIQRLVSTDSDVRSLLQFQNLTQLELNEFEWPHLDLVLEFARRQRLPYLNELHCNVNYLKSTNQAIHSDDLTLLRALYDRLRKEPPTTITRYPKIHFHGIPLDLALPFDDYLLGAELISAHMNGPAPDHYKRSQITECCYVDPFADLFAGRPFALVWMYPNIRMVCAYRAPDLPPINDVTFLDFLKLLHSLVDLDLRNTGLSDSFYSKLSTKKCVNEPTKRVVEALNSLTIIDAPRSAGLRFGFVEYCPRLRHLHTNQADKNEALHLLDLNQAKPVHQLRFDYMFLGDRVVAGKARATFGYFRWTIMKRIRPEVWPPQIYELAIGRCLSESMQEPGLIYKPFHKQTFRDVRTLRAFINSYLMSNYALHQTFDEKTQASISSQIIWLDHLKRLEYLDLDLA